LISIAISHYQFETVHPFLDGNGRIGRLLIPLYLVSNELLLKPTLYLSAFFEKRRASYYDALSRVRESNDMTHWIKFFLNAVLDTATHGKETFKRILELKNNTDQQIIKMVRKAENANQLMQYLFEKPLVNVKAVIKNLDIGKKAGRELIRDFEKSGILSEVTGYKRNRIFVFKSYLDLF